MPGCSSPATGRWATSTLTSTPPRWRRNLRVLRDLRRRARRLLHRADQPGIAEATLQGDRVVGIVRNDSSGGRQLWLRYTWRASSEERLPDVESPGSPTVTKYRRVERHRSVSTSSTHARCSPQPEALGRRDPANYRTLVRDGTMPSMLTPEAIRGRCPESAGNNREGRVPLPLARGHPRKDPREDFSLLAVASNAARPYSAIGVALTRAMAVASPSPVAVANRTRAEPIVSPRR